VSAGRGHDVVIVYVGLGSNLDDPVSQVRAGVTALGQLPHTRFEACSSFYASAPVGTQAQPDFINAACRLQTALEPDVLMRGLMEIEQAHGRVRRGEKGGPRTLDLDLLLFGAQVIHSEALTVPHPRLHERAFVLYPLSELDPGLEIPGQGRASDLLAMCADQIVRKLEIRP